MINPAGNAVGQSVESYLSAASDYAGEAGARFLFLGALAAAALLFRTEMFNINSKQLTTAANSRFSSSTTA